MQAYKRFFNGDCFYFKMFTALLLHHLSINQLQFEHSFLVFKEKFYNTLLSAKSAMIHRQKINTIKLIFKAVWFKVILNAV
jgi:hypothetical protein